MQIAVLGPLTIDGDGRGLARRDRVVLQALAVHRGDVVSPDSLADALWGEDAPASAAKVVQGCIVRLRRALGGGAIETVPHGYRLALGPDQVDSSTFEGLLARGRELLVLGEPDRAGFLLDEALGLWRGDPLLDLADWEMGRLEANRLEAERLDAEELRLDAALRAGRYREVLGTAQRLVEQAPLRERRWGLLALAQYQAGRQAEALRTIRQVRGVLSDELGLDPGPELAALEQAILRQDVSLLPVEMLPELAAACPYPGLAAYDVDDADGFFGREADVDRCLARLAETGVLAVVGPSGGGKSSLVRAGVAAALRRQDRKVVVVTPGRHPMDVLSVLPRARSVVLVVDQCEEVFSLVDDPGERTAFLAALGEHATRAPLVLALRADRTGDLAAVPEFARLVESGLYLLGPMGGQDLRAAIEGPARQAGLLLEPGLVDLLVRDVEGEPGALPLLSHALREAWLRREGRTLTVAGYRNAGGISGAVAKSAEDVYETIGPQQRPVLRDLMLRLVAPGTEGEAVRSRVPRRLVAEGPEQDHIIERLVSARLVTSDDGMLALAHEALTRAWPRLQGWLDEDSDGVRILRHVSAAAEAWDAMGRPASELYRGSRLAQTVEWRERIHPSLTATERDFLAAAETLETSERRALASQARRQRRVNRRLRTLLAVVAVLLLVAALAGLAALRSADEADRSAAAAEASALVADARRLGAQALQDDDVDQSMLLAAEAVAMDDSPDTRSSLAAALARNPQLVAAARGTGGAFYRLDVSPDGASFAVHDDANTVWFYDTDSLRVLGSYDANVPGAEQWSWYPTSAVDHHPSGDLVAVGVQTLEKPAVRLLDTDTFRLADVQLGGLPSRPSLPIDLQFSADGRFLAVSFAHFRGGAEVAYSASMWRLSDPRRPVRRITDVEGWASVALSPDGGLLFLAAADGLTRYDMGGRGEARNLDQPGSPLEIGTDARHLALVDGRDVVLVDGLTGEETRRLRGHDGPVINARFSDDGRYVVSTGDDLAAIVWDARTGGIVERLPVGARNLWGVGLSPDGSIAYTAAGDRSLAAWDVSGRHRFIPRQAHANLPSSDVVAAIPSPDARKVAYLLVAGGLRIMDVETGVLGDRRDTHHREFGDLDWAPDGTWLVTTGADGAVRRWSADGRLLDSRTGVASGHIAGIDVLPGGTRIVIGVRTGEVSVLSADTLERVGPIVDVGGRLSTVDASPDGHTAVAIVGQASRSPTTFGPAREWVQVDLPEGRVVGRGPTGLDEAWDGAFSPDGRLFGTAGLSGELALIDLDKRAPVTEVVTDEADFGVGSVDFSDDGQRVVTTGGAGRVALWDAETGALIGSANPTQFQSTARFRPDNQTVVVADLAGQVFTWDTRIAHAVDFACQVAGRNFTRSEWSHLVGERPYHRTCS